MRMMFSHLRMRFNFLRRVRLLKVKVKLPRRNPRVVLVLMRNLDLMKVLNPVLMMSLLWRKLLPRRVRVLPRRLL
jgi:hypothetical protein